MSEKVFFISLVNVFIFTTKNRTLAGKLIEHSPFTTTCIINKSGD